MSTKEAASEFSGVMASVEEQKWVLRDPSVFSSFLDGQESLTNAPPNADTHHRGKFDFLYLPVDFRNACNLGYAFMNFLSVEAMVQFYQTYHGERWRAEESSTKVRDWAVDGTGWMQWVGIGLFVLGASLLGVLKCTGLSSLES